MADGRPILEFVPVDALVDDLTEKVQVSAEQQGMFLVYTSFEAHLCHWL